MKRAVSALALTAFALGSIACAATPAATTSAKSAADSLSAAAGDVDKAITALQSGDIEKAKKEYKEYNEAWDRFEDSVKAKSADSYKKIEDAMDDVSAALIKATTVDKDKALAALRKLRQVIDAELPRLK